MSTVHPEPHLGVMNDYNYLATHHPLLKLGLVAQTYFTVWIIPTFDYNYDKVSLIRRFTNNRIVRKNSSNAPNLQRV